MSRNYDSLVHKILVSRPAFSSRIKSVQFLLFTTFFLPFSIFSRQSEPSIGSNQQIGFACWFGVKVTFRALAPFSVWELAGKSMHYGH